MRNSTLPLFAATLVCATFGLSDGMAQRTKPGTPPATTQLIKVTKVVAQPTVAKLSGPCPTTGNFAGTITASAPTDVSYRWERSDGSAGPTQKLHVAGTTIQVKDVWAAEGQYYKSGQTEDWEILHVVSPTDMRSPQASVQVQCTPGLDISIVPPPMLGGQGQNASNGSPCIVHLDYTFSVWSNRPTDITYHFERSGQQYQPSDASLTHPAPTTSPVTAHIGQSYPNGAYAINIGDLTTGLGTSDYYTTLVITSPYSVTAKSGMWSIRCYGP